MAELEVPKSMAANAGGRRELELGLELGLDLGLDLGFGRRFCAEFCRRFGAMRNGSAGSVFIAERLWRAKAVILSTPSA